MFFRALIPSTAIAASHPAVSTTNLLQSSSLLPIAEKGDFICRTAAQATTATTPI